MLLTQSVPSDLYSDWDSCLFVRRSLKEFYCILGFTYLTGTLSHWGSTQGCHWTRKFPLVLNRTCTTFAAVHVFRKTPLIGSSVYICVYKKGLKIQMPKKLASSFPWYWQWKLRASTSAAPHCQQNPEIRLSQILMQQIRNQGMNP